MQDGEELRNWRIKEYLEDTDKALQTERDILVTQIIEVMETSTDEPLDVDLDSFYDRDIDEIVRFLELEHAKMLYRTREKERKEKYWDQD